MPTGYARASTDDQSLGLRRGALRPAGRGKLREHGAGSTGTARAGNRPKARRLGRSLRGLTLLGRSPGTAGIGLMGTQKVNTGSSDCRLVFHLRA